MYAASLQCTCDLKKSSTRVLSFVVLKFHCSLLTVVELNSILISSKLLWWAHSFSVMGCKLPMKCLSLVYVNFSENTVSSICM